MGCNYHIPTNNREQRSLFSSPHCRNNNKKKKKVRKGDDYLTANNGR